MLYLYVGLTARHAENKFREVVADPYIKPLIKKVSKHGFFVVKLVNGDEIHFITDAQEPTWTLGRTYRILNGGTTLYHSGFELPEKNQQKPT